MTGTISLETGSTAAVAGHAYRLLIDGALVDGVSTFPVINPATAQPFAHCPKADEAMLDRAVLAAGRAFGGWSASPVEERAALLLRLADAMEIRLEDFAALLTREQGKPLAQAHMELLGSIGTLRAFSAMRTETRLLREREGSHVVEHRRPLGVVAAITPWNFPLILLMNKLGPALVTGNTLVIKPAPTTPLTTLLLGELCQAILPAGVVNIICDQNDLGSALVGHPGVAKIAFTGSTATGRKVMATAAEGVKRVTLELGGNDAALVLDDVDPILAARKVFAGAMANAGQVCVAIKRVYVPETLHDEFCAELVRLADAMVVGDGALPGSMMGPLQNVMQFEKVKALLDGARTRGTILAGGAALDRPGYFIAPTIVAAQEDSDPLVSEEQFGPVLPVLRYRDLDDAISRVNDSIYGLAATIWSSSEARAREIAARIDAGTVWINQHLAMDPSIPFRGAKQSGIGGELGLAGLHEYTQAHVVNSVPLANIGPHERVGS